MRKMLNTLYITSEDYYLACSNENVVVHQGETIIARFPLINLEGIVTFSYAGAACVPWQKKMCCPRNTRSEFCF